MRFLQKADDIVGAGRWNMRRRKAVTHRCDNSIANAKAVVNFISTSFAFFRGDRQQ